QIEQARSEDESFVMDLVQQLDLGRTTMFDKELEDRIKGLKVEDINATLKKYVDPKKFSVVKVGDFKAAAAPK
ncbi:MAG TPA: hypothetical protein VGE37_13440, partial [Archangium sp.]